MTEHGLEFYRGIARERDELRKLVELLCEEPAITIAEHADQSPEIIPVLRRHGYRLRHESDRA